MYQIVQGLVQEVLKERESKVFVLRVKGKICGEKANIWETVYRNLLSILYVYVYKNVSSGITLR